MEQATVNLINDLRQHKRAAQERLLTAYGPRVFRLVLRIVGRYEDAEEVYQDVFVKALRSINTYDHRQASLATWLNRIAYNESLNFVRRTRPVLVNFDEQDKDIDSMDIPDFEHHDEQTIQLLEKALTKLAPSEQAVITMFYYDDLSLREIAYVTGSIPSTVGSQLSRIRKKLYRIIQAF